MLQSGKNNWKPAPGLFFLILQVIFNSNHWGGINGLDVQ